MATVYAPIAKDESINTTESPSRNVADVLAQELSGIASAITGGSDKAPKTDIATVEPTNTASRAYSVGELVYVNGNLYKVITAIVGGATFTVGTNIQSTNVSDAIEETSVSIFDNGGYLTAVKYSKVVKVSILGNGITNGENWNVVLGNLRPKKPAVGLVSDLSDGTMYWLRLDTGLDVTIISLTGSEQQSKVISQACGELTFIAE